MNPIDTLREVQIFREATPLPRVLTNLVLEYLYFQDMQTCIRLGLSERFSEVFVEGSCFKGPFTKAVVEIAMTAVVEIAKKVELAIFMRNVSPEVREKLGTISLKSWNVGEDGFSDCLPLHTTITNSEGRFLSHSFCVWERSETTMRSVMQVTVEQIPEKITNFRFSDDKTRVVVRRTMTTYRGKQTRYRYYSCVYDIRGNRLVLFGNAETPRDVYIVGKTIFMFELASDRKRITFTRHSVDDALKITSTNQNQIVGNIVNKLFFHRNSLKLYYPEKDPSGKLEELKCFDCQSLTSYSLNLKFWAIWSIHVQGEILALSVRQETGQEVRVYHLSNVNDADHIWTISLELQNPAAVRLYRDKLYVLPVGAFFEYTKDGRTRP